jgi:ABC-2 type transport system permease protein
MLRLLQVELIKVFTRPRTYISFGVVFLIVFLFSMGMYFEGESLVAFATEAIDESFNLEGQIINGYLITYILFNSLLIQIPILIALVTGDQMSGEFSSGTIRLIMIRPHKRSAIYLSKILVGIIYTVLLMLFMLILCAGFGMILFGDGDLVVLRRGISVFNSDDLFWRFGGAFLFGTLSMILVASLSNFFSTISKNSIGPIVGTIATLIGLNIITTLGLNLLKPILPLFFNVHFIKWQYWFDYNLNTEALITSFFIQLFYILLFYLLGYVIFKKQDILH